MKQLSATRRAFLKLAAVVAGASAVSGGVAATALADNPDAVTTPATEVKRVRTACRGCGKMECGVWVTVENGRAVKVEGDESAYQANGNCCTKSQASIQAAYHPARLRYPMKRTNPKGEDPGWTRISWDEALSASHTAFTELMNKYGGEGIMSMTGTSRFWGMGSNRIGRLYGAVNNHGAAQVCKGIRRMSSGYTIENGTFFQENVAYPKVYVQWGTAQSYSNYDDACRTIVETISRSEKYILVDPRVNNEGKEADIHLALRPGTDGAMALGWTHLVMKNGWEDHEFCTRWSNAPFLYCEDLTDDEIQPFETGKWAYAKKQAIKTRLLRECDLVEGGSVSRFMVWDELNQCLCWFDADETVGMWEGEDDYCIPTTFTDYVRPSGKTGEREKGDVSGRIPDKTKFKVDRDPSLWYEGEVTLKDGRVARVKTVWKKYWDDVVSKYTPEYVGEVCGVDPALIEQAVEAWAGQRYDERFANGGINYQLAPEQSGNAFQNFRALAILSAIVGAYDNPGGNRGMTRTPIDAGGTTSPDPYVALPKSSAKAASAERYPIYSRDAHACWIAALEGTPYPIRGCICFSGDFLNQSNANYGAEALQSMDFMLDGDLWHHPTNQYADILVPAEHWLEIPGFARISQGSHGAFGANVNCIEPIGEVKYDIEIGILMHKQAGVPFFDPEDDRYPDPWSPISRYLDWQVQETGMTGEEYMKTFAEHGWWKAKEEYPDIWGTYQRYRMGKLRQPDGMQTRPGDNIPGMTTHTMKCEIWSTALETRYGFMSKEEMPEPLRELDLSISEIAFPEWIPSPLSKERTPELFEEYPFNMTTGRRNPVYFHTEHRQLPWCRELWPVPRVEINPVDAEKLGIQQGDWVWIESKDGKIRQVADLYYGISEGVINCEHGWWFPEMKHWTFGWELVNVNCLVDRWAQDPFVGSSQLRAYPVKIYKATEENSPFGNPCPCDPDTGEPVISTCDDVRLKEWNSQIEEIAADTGKWEEYAK